MRHNKVRNRLGRNSSHRQALLRNMASSLFRHGRINTTISKAKALRPYAEKLITKAINAFMAGSIERRLSLWRNLRADIRNKESFRYLTYVLARHCYLRPGGYTRIYRLGQRTSDGAEMALIEIVLEPVLTNDSGAITGALNENNFKTKYTQIAEQYLADMPLRNKAIKHWSTCQLPTIRLERMVVLDKKNISFDLIIDSINNLPESSWPVIRGRYLSLPLTISIRHPVASIKSSSIEDTRDTKCILSDNIPSQFKLLINPEISCHKLNGKIEALIAFNNIAYCAIDVFSPLGELYSFNLITQNMLGNKL